jgi:predicted KAP-like P-loop ATPase
LLKFDKKIVLIIDDLDRIKFEQFSEILRIINITRDFPNIIFVLAFDYENINKFDVTFKDRFLNFDNKDIYISEDINNSRIIKYLEKIIDVKYLLTFDMENIKSFFLSNLSSLFKNYYNDQVNYTNDINNIINELYSNKNFRLY